MFMFTIQDKIIGIMELLDEIYSKLLKYTNQKV